MDREIVSKGVNEKGNKYTKFSDDSYRYDNSDGYHYKNSNGKFLSYCRLKLRMKSNLGSTFTRKGDRETYKPPNGNTGWTRSTNEE